ncbi:MAG: hypothetical protein O7B79_03915, partial [SAR324 cluster bacterium]|nr:hypothetical protein [SAR324 cluster bacterium]
SVDIPSDLGAARAGVIPILEELTDLRASYFWHVASGIQYGIEWISKEVTAHAAPNVPVGFGGLGPTATNKGDAARLQFTGRYKF